MCSNAVKSRRLMRETMKTNSQGECENSIRARPTVLLCFVGNSRVEKNSRVKRKVYRPVDEITHILCICFHVFIKLERRVVQLL